MVEKPDDFNEDDAVGLMFKMFCTSCGDRFRRDFSSSFFGAGGSSTMTVDVRRVNSSGDFPDTKTVTIEVLGDGGSGSAVED